MINDEYIKNNFLNYSGKINRWSLKNINKEELEYLNNRYNDSDSINETILRIKNNINIHPCCPVCGKKLKFIGGNKIFPNHCSKKCSKNDPKVQKKLETTCIKKYGVINPGCSKQALEKIKKTKLQKYGNEYYTNREKAKQTCKEKFGEEYYLNVPKFKNQSKETCLKKYGCEYTGQAEIKKQHSKETFIKHYGVDHNWKNKECFQKCIENRFKNRIEINNITSSKPEQICFELLKTKFNKVIRQKRDKTKYPFYCDFYIKDIDTWIEYNGFMTHGGHPFNPNSKKDQDKLNELNIKNNNHKYPGNNLYNSTIKIWTVYDPLKRKIAKVNKLNYLEFWTINELEEWLNKI